MEIKEFSWRMVGMCMTKFSKALATVVLVVVAIAAEAAIAQSEPFPVYSRSRSGALGGGAWRGEYRPPARPPFDQANIGYFGYAPTVAGSWYTRPYPYHFDYYRWRYSTPRQTVDCPCAEATVVE